MKIKTFLLAGGLSLGAVIAAAAPASAPANTRSSSYIFKLHIALVQVQPTLPIDRQHDRYGVFEHFRVQGFRRALASLSLRWFLRSPPQWCVHLYFMSLLAFPSQHQFALWTRRSPLRPRIAR